MENKKKILYIITKSNWGGAQRYVFDLATAAAKDKYEVVVAAGGTGQKKTGQGKFFELLQQKGIKTIFIKPLIRNISLTSDFSSFIEIWKIIKKEQPGIIHLNSSKAAGLGALAGKLIGIKKIIFTVHGLPSNEERPAPQKMAISFLTWLTAILATNIITISERDKIALTKWPFLKKDKIQLIHNSISECVFKEKISAKTAILTALTDDKDKTALLAEGSIWVGTIGELTANKGLEFLIEALAKTANAGICGIIIGDGEKRNELEKMASAAGLTNQLFFTGFLNEAASLLKAFDIFVLPSKKEGAPYVLLEAGLAEVPVVATNVGGIPDLLEDMVSGIIVKPKSSSDLAKAMDFLAEHTDSRKNFAEKLLAKINKDFSFEKMVLLTEETYKNS